ncbi:MAG: hypothetical protein K9N07_07400 [Candidatus Cloacimonetes bacterium]|nr:hypothetical protein [Candidatus Cloacimonadota bacterium]
MNIDQNWHKEQVEKYREELPHYKIYANFLEQVLKKAGNKYAPLCIVQSRAKGISSFAEKAVRKAHKYKDPVNQITDLCGARIITHFQYQVDRISQFIKSNFLVDELNSIDVSTRLQVSEFGYLSVHYIVIPQSDTILGIRVPEEIKDKKAEIQVRTLLQHTWADIAHDRMYKAPIAVPKSWQREMYGLAAIMENSDIAFKNLSEKLDYYTDNYGTMLSEENLLNEISVVETILNNETEKENKPVHALKLAKLIIATGDWERVIKVLEPIVSANIGDNAENIILLGLAICHFHKSDCQSDEYKSGQKYLEQIAQPEKEIFPEKDYDRTGIDDNYYSARRARALFSLGKTYGCLEKNISRAKDLFYKAYQLDPSNPYYHAAYIEFEICSNNDSNIIYILKPSILQIIETCKEHIILDIEIIKAYFTIGRLLFLIGEIAGSIAKYSKAIDLCISNKTHINKETFDDEIDIITELNRNEKVDSRHFEWICDLLLLAKIIKYNDETAKNQIKSKSLSETPFEEPVIIVAGGAEDMPKYKLPDYQHFLTSSLQSFTGTVFAGGTTSGIPGLVGLATQAVRRNKNGHFQLIGYLPKELPKDAKADSINYDKIHITDSIGFSIKELIQYWIDIIISGIKPAKVLVLGINGGRISDLEYRLALALGATVGLVESSGRAATGLLLDGDWVGHERIIVIPHEVDSIWAFINQNKPSKLTTVQVNEAAEQVHKDYLAKKIASGSTTDKSMLPWKNLPAELQDSNRQQVIFMECILSMVGYKIQPSENPQLVEFDKDEIMIMAKMEHARWTIEKLNSGWKYGPRKDTEKKLSPYLVSWDNLTRDIQDYDVNAVINFPKVLKKARFEIIQMKR